MNYCEKATKGSAGATVVTFILTSRTGKRDVIGCLLTGHRKLRLSSFKAERTANADTASR